MPDRPRTRPVQRLILGSMLREMPSDTLPSKRSPQEPDVSGKLEEPEVPQHEDLQGLYIISVAARLLEMHPQTLRKYERIGLVNPSRTLGMLRLYSEEDIARLRLIKHLVDGLHMNLAGVEFALQLLHQVLEVRERIAALEELDRAREDLRRELATIMELLDVALPTVKNTILTWEELS